MPVQFEELPFYLTVVWVLVGIIISLILPVAVHALKSESGFEAGGRKRPSVWKRFTLAWTKYKGNQYLLKVLAAVVVAFALVLLLGLKFYTVRDAVIAGFAWESLIDKLSGQQ